MNMFLVSETSMILKTLIKDGLLVKTFELLVEPPQKPREKDSL